MKTLLLFLVVAVPAWAAAQMGVVTQPPMIYTDVRGMPIPIHTNYNTEGSPFLMPDYCRATIKVQKGKTYQGVSVKVNLQDNAIYFKFDGQPEMVATVPIEYIEFTECKASGRLPFIRSGFPAIDKKTESTYYEVLSDGDVKLLKYVSINYQEQTPYNGTQVMRIYQQTPQYYAYSKKKGIVKLKDSETALYLLADHREQARRYIAEQNIKMKKEDDLVKLISFYNTL